MKKPTSSDPEQRRHDTRVSRFQSGLPPEDEVEQSEEEAPKPAVPKPRTGEKPGSTED